MAHKLDVHLGSVSVNFLVRKKQVSYLLKCQYYPLFFSGRFTGTLTAYDDVF